MKIQIKRPVALHEAGGKSLNEDFIWPTKDKASVEEELFIVCDGEGGPNAGENASKLIGLSFAKFYASTPPVENTQKAYLEAALMKAEAALTAYKEDHEDKKQMKATLSLLHFGKSEACLAWVGDSQAYYYSHAKSELIGSNNSGPGSEDDEFIEGSHKPATINCISIPYDEISEKDYFFLGSKGIAEQVGSTTLSAMFSAKNKPEPEFIAGEINSLSEGFTKDNYSCYLIQVENVMGDVVVTEAGETINVADSKTEPAKEMAAAAMTASENIYEEKSNNNFWTNVVIGVLAFAFVWVLVALWVGNQENKYDVYMNNAEQLISQKNYLNALDQIDSALNHIDREIASNNLTRSEASSLIAEANKRKKEIRNLIARNSGVERKFDLASLESTPEEYLEWAHEAMRLKNFQLALDNYEKAKIKRGEASEPAIPEDSLALAYLMLGNELFDAEDRDCNKVLAYFNKAFSYTESKILDQGNSIYTQSLRRSGSCNLALGRTAGDPNQITQNSRGLDLNPDANKKTAETNKESPKTPAKKQARPAKKSQGTSRSNENNSNKRLAPTSGINSTNLSPEDESRMRKALSDGKRFYSQAKSQDSDYLYRQSAIQLEQAATVLDGSGAYLLAYVYHMGLGVDVDNAKALKFAQKSALKNWPAGHYLYAHLLLLRNNPRDTITARQSLNRAAELNYLDAFKRLEELQ
ncbi:MAG: protein phosphatase 2C domain-containing protein [Bacteroidota bacterium]